MIWPVSEDAAAAGGDIMWRAFGLNLLYLSAGYLAFRFFPRGTRMNGSLLSQGE